MKLWMKLFSFVFLLFILTFYVGIFLMSNLSYRAGLKTAREQAFAEHAFISGAFATDLDAILLRKRNEDSLPAIRSLMSNYSNNYKRQDVSFLLMKNGESVTGNIPLTNEMGKIMNPTNDRESIIVSKDSHKYLLVSGRILEDYVFLYSRDVTSLVTAQNQLIRKLILTQIGITFLFAIVLYLMLKVLTKPIQTLQTVTKQLSAGDYAIRAQSYGSDEISTLARHFNEMAEEIQSKIEEQKRIAYQKQQFIDNLSHELKTPLTTIYGYTEFLQKTRVSEEDLIEATDHIMQDVKRMQAMSKKLLDLAMTRGAVLDYQPLSTSTLFERLRKEMQIRLEKKHLSLIHQGEEVVIHGDAVLIESLFSNLLDNAIKASNENGAIYLSSNHADGKVAIEVRDEGIGIKEDCLANIFEPFYRTDTARTNIEGSTGGAGLGLALCKQIVEAHQAEMAVSSQPGKGTTVTIYFIQNFITPQQVRDNSTNKQGYTTDNVYVENKGAL